MSRARLKMFAVTFTVIATAAVPAAQQVVSFPTQDGGLVYGLVYGVGDRAVVLAHGGQFNKDAWDRQARAISAGGFRVLAIDFRGYGQSRGPSNAATDDDARRYDVLAAIQFLRMSGAKTVSVVGASMGGDYAAEAAEAEPGAIDRLVLLAAGAYTPLARMPGPKLFIMSRDDVIGDNQPRLPAIQRQYDKASSPKRFVVVAGSAHAQALFATSESGRVLSEIMAFLSAP
jgi:pimeloyl-ACP methyl ester carboxylesterase